jgi:hypothetical protein
MRYTEPEVERIAHVASRKAAAIPFLVQVWQYHSGQGDLSTPASMPD